MVRSDPEKLAAALRANLRKRKGQGRTPEPTFGADEEGDFPPLKEDTPAAPDERFP